MEEQAEAERAEDLNLSTITPVAASVRRVGPPSFAARLFPSIVRGVTGIFLLLIAGLFVELVVNSLPL